MLVLPAAVDDDRLDRRGLLDGVEVRAQQHRALRAPGDPRQQVARARRRRRRRRRPRRPRGPSRAGARRTSSAIARSSPNGLGIRQSSANVSLSRAFSASLAGRTHAGYRWKRPAGSPCSAPSPSARCSRGRDRRALLRAAERGAHELAEQRRRAVRARLELRVVLRGDEERVVVDLDHLDEALVRRRARDHQAGGLEPAAQEVVDLVAVAVALVDHGLAVDLARGGALVQLDRVGAQAHRAAHVRDLLLLGQEVDDRVRRLGVELGRVRAVHADDVARELRDRHLHAEADAQERDLLLAGDPRGGDLALDPALAEAARDQDAVDVRQRVARARRRRASRSPPTRSRRRGRAGSPSGAAPPRPTGRRPRA